MVSDLSLRFRAAFAAAAAVAALATTSVAFAQPSASDKETARSLMSQGDKAYDSKDYAGAVKSYQAAHAIMGLPETGLWVAKAQAGSGLLVEARDSALEVTRMPVKPNEPAAFGRARTEADALAKSLQPRIPSLTLKIEGAPAGAKVAVKVDGADVPEAAAALPRKVNPGKHTASASAAGASDAVGEIVVKEAESTSLTLQFGPASAPVAAVVPPAPPPDAAQPSNPPPSSGRSILVPIGFTIGGVGLVGGGVVLAIALVDRSKYEHTCATVGCNKADTGTVNGLLAAGGIGLGVGVGGVALGVVGLLKSGNTSTPPAKAYVQPYVSPTGAGLVGAF